MEMSRYIWRVKYNLYDTATNGNTTTSQWA
jgi:hypothetical protein